MAINDDGFIRLAEIYTESDVFFTVQTTTVGNTRSDASILSMTPACFILDSSSETFVDNLMRKYFCKAKPIGKKQWKLALVIFLFIFNFYLGILLALFGAKVGVVCYICC